MVVELNQGTGTHNYLRSVGNRSGLVTTQDTSDAKFARDLSQVAAMAGRLWSAADQRNKRLRDGLYVTSSVLNYKEFDYKLTKALLNVYRTDGTFALDSDFEVDLGDGFTIASKDFQERDRVRKSYTQVKKEFTDRYINHLKERSPSPYALQAVNLKLREQELGTTTASFKYESAWSLKNVGNAANSVIRAYKEKLSITQGYDPATFSEYVSHLGSIFTAARGVADPGGLQLAFRSSLTDLVKAGVAESGASSDNQMALAVLANTPLRSSKAVQEAIAGLPEGDFQYFQEMVGKYPKSTKPYKWGSAFPNNPKEAMKWAMSQIPSSEIAGIQGNALKAFAAQTKQARARLDARLSAALSGVSSVAIKDNGFRESLKKSIATGISETHRLYPANLYPAINAKKIAGFLSMGKIQESRALFDETHTSNLRARAVIMAEELAQEIQKDLGERGTMYAAAAPAELAKYLVEMADKEKELRQKHPYEAILKASKEARRIEQKLDLGNYRSFKDQVLDQNALYTAAIATSTRLGLRASFLSGVDRMAAEDFVKLGDRRGFYNLNSKLRVKYGDTIFFNHIAPALSQLEGAGSEALASAFFREQNIAQMFLSAMDNLKQNKETIKARGQDEKLFSDSTAKAWFWQSNRNGDKYDLLGNRIREMLGDTVNAAKVNSSVRAMVQAMAHQLAADGKASSGDAEGMALDLMIRGYVGTLGNTEGVSWDGGARLTPPAFRLSANDTAHLRNVVRSEKFIMEQLVPRVREYSQSILTTAKMTGKTPEQTFMETAQDSDIVRWDFKEEGLAPMYYEPLLGLSAPIPEKGTNLPIVFPYNELPGLLSGHYPVLGYYNELAIY